MNSKQTENAKYSCEKIEENKSYVWHTEGDTKTLIAVTDTLEKAHFLSTAANSFSLPSKPVGDPLAPPTCKNCNSELGDCDCGEWEPEYPSDKSGYAAAPQKGMRESIITDEQIEQAWGYANFGSTPKRKVISESLKKVAQGYHNGSTATAITKELGLIEGREKNRYYVLTDLGLKYLLADESPSPSEAGDGWVSEKPKEFTEDCILLTMSFHKVGPIFNAFEIRKTEGYDENENPIWYWGIFQDGDEWGDYADLYKIVPFPAPPIQK